MNLELNALVRKAALYMRGVGIIPLDVAVALMALGVDMERLETRLSRGGLQ